ncbi:MAG: glycosyltransferase family 2 protein [Candidatus Moranbacteria bacterium]|nr:glycosyltransferase family 2 protein [Candidatus Moranbacteria bacterium]
MFNSAVIIANWNGKKYLKDCLDSLAGQSSQDFKIVFVDNGSNDGSLDFVRENYAEKGLIGRMEILSLENNTGFARGYNIGIEKAFEDKNIKYIFAINNDTRLDKYFVEKMACCAESHPGTGSIQPKILNFFEPKKIDCLGIVFASDGTAHNRGYGEMDKGQFDQEEEVFGANATAALYTREALETTQQKKGEYFDGNFFAYYEDTDLAWRLRLAGYAAYSCPKAIVWHVHSATAGKASLFKAYYLHRNYFFAVFKNLPFGIMIEMLAHRSVSYFRLVLNIFRKEKKAAEYVGNGGKGKVGLAILKAWGSVLANLPHILEQRRKIQKSKKVPAKEIRTWLKKFATK